MHKGNLKSSEQLSIIIEKAKNQRVDAYTDFTTTKHNSRNQTLHSKRMEGNDGIRCIKKSKAR